LLENVKGGIEMVTVKMNVIINRSIEEVFSFVSDVDKIPLWAGPVTEAKLTSEGPVGVGSTSTKVQHILGRKMDADYEVTEYEKNRKFSEKTTSGPLDIESRITLEAANGGTKVNVEAEIETGGFFKIAEPVFANVIKRQVNTDFENLKDMLESMA
jgi:uncharacterized membrane protein